MEEIRVRPLRDEEIPEIAALWRRSRFDALPELEGRQGHDLDEDIAYFRAEIAGAYQVEVALRGERPVGFIATAEGSRQTAEGSRQTAEGSRQTAEGSRQTARADLDRLYVEPSEQGTGIGSLLLDRAKTRHPEGLRLYTHQINTRARRFYEARGFRAIAFGVSPPPENEPDVTYDWP